MTFALLKLTLKEALFQSNYVPDASEQSSRARAMKGSRPTAMIALALHRILRGEPPFHK
jgi:hypothetical protein